MLAVLLAGAIGEALVRILGAAPGVRTIAVTIPDGHYQWSNNPVLGYELRPNVREHPGTNSFGCVDVERTVAKAPGVRRIILLGDSVVEGFEEGTDLTVDQLMHLQLQKLYGDGKTEVLNLAVGGYCTLAEVERLRTRGLQFRPDVVVMVFVQNDFDDFNSEAGVLASRPRPWGVNWAFRHCQLFRLACVKFDWFDFVASTDPVKRNAAAVGSSNVVEGLRRFKALALANGFEPWLAIWPQFSDKQIIDGPFLNNETMFIEALAAANEIPTARLSDYFKTHLRSYVGAVNPRLTYTISDGMHPNATGCQVAAKALKAMLESTPDTRRMSFWKSQGPALARMAEDVVQARSRQSQFDYSTALIHYGDMLLDKKPADAMQYYTAALQVKPGVAGAHFGLARACLALNDNDKALFHAQQLLDVAVGDGRVLPLKGAALWRMRRLEEALACFEQAAAVAPSVSKHHEDAAAILVELNRFSQAKAHLNAALAARPDDPQLRKKLDEIDAKLSPASAPGGGN